MSSSRNKKLNFKKAAIYKIIVQGVLDESWSDRYRGMQITVERKKEQTAISTLVGEIRDQSALSGILNTLYEIQMTVISVNMLTEIDD